MTDPAGRRGGQPGIDQISTHWPMINDPVQFVMRYGPAIQGYLSALLKDPHAVEEVSQDFLLHVLQTGFVQEGDVRGRFRAYLITAVRNAALSHLRRKQPARADSAALQHVAAPQEDLLAADQAWLTEWRRCLLASVWEALEEHQRRAPGNLGYTVLRLTADHPDEDSRQLAARAAAATGRPLQPEAFRKQVSRARRLFAELVVKEVERTLKDPTPERVDEELVSLNLLKYVRPFLDEPR
jgi:hypothetical protein